MVKKLSSCLRKGPPGKERLSVRAVGAVCAHVPLPQLTWNVRAATVDGPILAARTPPQGT